MNAPDKIYVPTDIMEPEGLCFDLAGTVRTFRDDIEYISKDALLEWAKNMRLNCKDAKPIEKAYQTMIDKIESL